MKVSFRNMLIDFTDFSRLKILMLLLATMMSDSIIGLSDS